MIKGMNFTDAGIGSVSRPDGYSDLQGKGVITTTDGEKASYTYMAIGHADNGILRSNGAIFFHTNSTGKLASINGLVVIFKEHIVKPGNGADNLNCLFIAFRFFFM